MKKGIRALLQLGLGSLACLVGFNVSASIDLGLANNYLVLGIGGTGSEFKIYQSDTVVRGNVGVGANTTFAHGIDATITGRLDYDTTVTLPSITGTIEGGTHQQPMSAVIQDALEADTYYSGLTPTTTFATLSDGQTITGNGGQNVIHITDPVSLKTTLTLKGTASDTFIFQLTSTLKDPLVLSGVQMSLEGVSPLNILWDLTGTGGDVTISSGECNVAGIFLAPYRNITVDNAYVTGRIIGGGGDALLSIHSGSTIIPEPTTVIAGVLLLLPFGASTLRWIRKTQRS